MPFIHVHSLPFDPPREMDVVVSELTRDFAAASGVALEQVTAMWTYIPAGHYAVGGVTAYGQMLRSHPLRVELVTPYTGKPDSSRLHHMLHGVAQSIASHTGVAVDNIFIEHRYAQAGHLFEAGEVLRWPVRD